MVVTLEILLTEMMHSPVSNRVSLQMHTQDYSNTAFTEDCRLELNIR